MSSKHKNEHAAMAQQKARKAVRMAGVNRELAIDYMTAFAGASALVRDEVLAAGVRTLIDGAMKERGDASNRVKISQRGFFTDDSL